MDFKEYHAYFCHGSADIKWVMNLINSLESDKNKFKCAEYERDLIVGQYVLDLFEHFMDSSHFIVVILSPSFFESKWSKFQLHLAVQFSLEKNLGNIIPLVYRECEVPVCMKVFDPVHVSAKGWRLKLIERLGRPAKRFPKDKGICTRDGRISIDALRPNTVRDVKSEPPIGKESTLPLSAHVFSKVECFHYNREATLDSLQREVKTDTPGDSPECSLKLSQYSQLSGERAQLKRNSNQKQRISADDIITSDTTSGDEDPIRESRRREHSRTRTPIQHNEQIEKDEAEMSSPAKKTPCDVILNILQRKGKDILPNKPAKRKIRKQRPEAKHMLPIEVSAENQIGNLVHHEFRLQGNEATTCIRHPRYSDDRPGIRHPRYSDESSDIRHPRYFDESYDVRHSRYSDEGSDVRHPRYSDESSDVRHSRYSDESYGLQHSRYSEYGDDVLYPTSSKAFTQMKMIPCICPEISDNNSSEPTKHVDLPDPEETASPTGNERSDQILKRRTSKEEICTTILPNRAHKRSSSGNSYEDVSSGSSKEHLVLPDRLLYDGQRAKHKRLRPGRTERIDVDILLNYSEFEGTRL